MTVASQRLPYRPHLDGLRAVAALSVVGFHSTTHLPGGWVGVQVFFVLSGYLIFSLLALERGRFGRIDFLAFMRRRLARLYPALLVATALGGVALALYPHRSSGGAGVTLTSTVFYFGNWVNFFDPQSTGPLVHTWTLGIEQQFYLVIPFAVGALLVLRARRRAVILLSLAAAFFAARLVTGSLVGYDRSFFATWSQMDCLTIGCCLATLDPLIRRRPVILAAVGSFLAYLVWCLVGPQQQSLPGQAGGALIAIGLAGAVIGAHADSTVGRVLATKPLVELGKRSYGIYLYHFPIAWMLQAEGLPSFVTVPSIPAAAIVAAWLSFRYVEVPARRRLTPELVPVPQ